MGEAKDRKARLGDAYGREDTAVAERMVKRDVDRLHGLYTKKFGNVPIFGPHVRIDETLSHVHGGPVLRFQFDGGEGLIMGLAGITCGTIRKGETYERALKESKYRTAMNLLKFLLDAGALEERESGGEYRVPDDVWFAIFPPGHDEEEAA
jgi:hypothetical protein